LPVESQKRITFPAVDNGRLAQTKVYYAAAEVMNKETIYREREKRARATIIQNSTLTVVFRCKAFTRERELKYRRS
jgi:hypothetical protein